MVQINFAVAEKGLGYSQDLVTSWDLRSNDEQDERVRTCTEAGMRHLSIIFL